MSDKGFIAIARAALDHPIVGAEKPYSRFVAWVWLVREAVFKPRRVVVTNGRTNAPIKLQRGQFSHSLGFMSEAWGWSVKRVRTFLNRLKTDSQIETQTDGLQTVITICNYEKYQSPANQEESQTGRQNGTQRAGNGQEEEQLNKETKESKSSVPEDPASPEAQFWNLSAEFSKAGVVRSRMGQLAKSCNGDFIAALRIGREILKAKQPNSYLTAVLKNMLAPEAEPFDPTLPGFVSAAKAEGARVQKHPNGWKINNSIFDEGGQEIGW